MNGRLAGAARISGSDGAGVDAFVILSYLLQIQQLDGNIIITGSDAIVAAIVTGVGYSYDHLTVIARRRTALHFVQNRLRRRHEPQAPQTRNRFEMRGI